MGAVRKRKQPSARKAMWTPRIIIGGVGDAWARDEFDVDRGAMS
jgi:hypothetical protein